MVDDATRILRDATLVTANPGKLAEARRICGADLRAVDIDLPEIQSLDIGTVLRTKAAEAFRRLRRPVIVDETALELSALNGFPGVLVKWMLQAIGAEGIARLALTQGETTARARCALLYLDLDREVLAQGVNSGRLVHPPRGEGGFGWDPIFAPAGCDRTYAELSAAEKDRISHRALAWKDLEQRLTIAP